MTGDPGADGRPGEPGRDGQDGLKGEPGLTGERGNTGKSLSKYGYNFVVALSFSLTFTSCD